MRVVVAEDSVLFREGLVRVLGDGGFEVVAQVGDASALHRAVIAEKPDVAVVDVRMPPTQTDGGDEGGEGDPGAAPEVALLLLSQVS